MSKGYGKLRPRFAKYFARKQNSAGAHDGGKAKRPEKDAIDHINEYTEEELEELKRRVRNQESMNSKTEEDDDEG